MSHVLRDHTVMSDVHEPELQEMETGRLLKANQGDGSTTSTPDMHGLPCSSQSTPSPSGEGSGLLSLPWEMVTQIASHLPAQCVISVLPKVCQALGNVGEDRTAWQRRAGRLTGSRVRFPVGPREGYDWPKACLEMEDLITCWADQADWVARHTQPREDGERGGHGPEDRGGGGGGGGGKTRGRWRRRRRRRTRC
ncbi:F-box/WD repeat-containing protein 9 [Merluccius polli]|uniref:F-box/WD repeat-containing protein 9 n=1 Tax=Merluccius polli TaxID=89951 RepID=A0AA47MHW6_MERPO|nr:F-box/WD repeat-containing protein 9 [Merluccius polli]